MQNSNQGSHVLKTHWPTDHTIHHQRHQPRQSHARPPGKACHYDDNMQITHINIIMTQISHFERYPVTIRNQYGKNSDAMLYLPVYSVNITIQIIHMKLNARFAYSFEKFWCQIHDIAITRIGLMLRVSGRFWHKIVPMLATSDQLCSSSSYQ